MNSVQFGNDEIYVGGFAIPEGDYALEFEVKMSTPKEGSGNVSRLGIEIRAHDLNDPDHRGDKAFTEFMSMGSKAHLSFAPNPDTGKGLVPIPGAAGVTMNDKTNWNIFRKSLYNSGLPQGVFTDDLSVLDGVHVHLGREPEPEERKGFAKAATGEQAMMGADDRTPKTIPVVTEIKEDGKPWEGTGGVPTGDAKPKARGAGREKVTITKKDVAKLPVAKNVAPTPAGADGDDVLTAAITAANSVMENNPKGLASVILLRTKMASIIKKADGEDMFQAVADTYFGDNDSTNSLLEHIGFAILGTKVVPTS